MPRATSAAESNNTITQGLTSKRPKQPQDGSLRHSFHAATHANTKKVPKAMFQIKAVRGPKTNQMPKQTSAQTTEREVERSAVTNGVAVRSYIFAVAARRTTDPSKINV
jgi:hypothetical protein